MKIKELYNADIQKYNELAMTYGIIFNTINWTRTCKKGIQHYGIYNEGDELIGGFLIFKENKFGMSIYRNPSFTPSIGPFLKIDAKNLSNIASTWKEAISLMADFFDKLPYSIISFSLNIYVVDAQPYIWRKFKVVPSYTYVLDLTLSVEDLWKRMTNERRKNVVKGEKDGLTVRKLEDLHVIKSLVNNTFLRQKMKFNGDCLDNILFEFASSDNSFAFGTYFKEDPIACAFCIYDRHTAYYILGGYDSENKHHGAGALAMWNAIKYAKDLGLKYFDFEGSMIPQIERYFRGFGGRLTPYYRINKARLPLEILLKFFKRDLF